MHPTAEVHLFTSVIPRNLGFKECCALTSIDLKLDTIKFKSESYCSAV